MSSLITLLQQKIMALALLVIVLWAISILLVVPGLSFVSDERAQISMLERRISNYQKIISNEPQYFEQLEKITADALPDLLYHGDTSETLDAEVSNDVRRLLSRLDIPIGNMQSVPISEENGVKRITVRMSLDMRMDVLAKLLEQLRNHSRLLFVENISIDASARQDDKSAPVLKVEWDIVGFGQLEQSKEAGT